MAELSSDDRLSEHETRQVIAEFERGPVTVSG